MNLTINTEQVAVPFNMESEPNLNQEHNVAEPPSSSLINDRPQARRANLVEIQRAGELSLDALTNSAMQCFPEDNSRHDTIVALYAFVEEIRKPHKKAEIAALKCLQAYKHNPKFLVDNKELQKLLPNVNVRKEKRLLQLFGVEALDLRDPKHSERELYILLPYKYILATMVNSPSYSNMDQKIIFAFQFYDQDGDGKISQNDLKELFAFYGKENQFALTEDIIEEIVKVISIKIGKDDDGTIPFENLKKFFGRTNGQKVKLNVFERGRTNFLNRSTDKVDSRYTEADRNDISMNKSTAPLHTTQNYESPRRAESPTTRTSRNLDEDKSYPKRSKFSNQMQADILGM